MILETVSFAYAGAVGNDAPTDGANHGLHGSNNTYLPVQA